ncbi:thioredoxin domain-containing protein [Streptococcus merionis]|uniref:Bacteriocin transport accessory protein n=1 Tax=Streptococcus merionis TaxID=400065 RepID=A0A239SRM4_9STRE|nr:thioredoxin domain-containing protein [Streptococcus merionis]SNU87909.1 bacteriocin transport accessory protein [Streptococcus merionis]
MATFEQDIRELHPVTIDHAKKTISDGQTATYFIGRSTCPYCRKFAAKLRNVVSETGATVYFVNSEQADQLAQLADFRSQYGIPTVPGFVQITDGQVSVKCDSSMTEAEIKAFMKA